MPLAFPTISIGCEGCMSMETTGGDLLVTDAAAICPPTAADIADTD